MIEAYDVRDEGRMADVILNSLNGMYDRKNAGALGKDEFASNIINSCDLIANYIEQGKMSNENIESAENHLTHLLGEDRDKYYAHPHKDLARAGKTGLESIYFAKEKLEQRNIAAQPVMDAESYEKTFRKLG